MRKTIAPLAAAALALLAAGCAPRSIYAENARPEVHELKVLSGDRMVIDGRTLTLANAETPRLGPQARCRAEDMAARQAAEASRTALAGARHLQVLPSAEGEDLRLVNLDGLDLGQSLIAQGLAVTRSPDAMDWCAGGWSAGAQVAAAPQGPHSFQ
jgi:hypothetical protein